jgi:hypothetical protein
MARYFIRCSGGGAHSEQVINVYSAIETHERPRVNPNYTVDAVIARLEGVLVRECEKGGTAASIKAAMDRAIDQIQIETSGPRDRARDAVARVPKKFRGKLDHCAARSRFRELVQELHVSFPRISLWILHKVRCITSS